MWYCNRRFILYNDSTTWSNDIEHSWLTAALSVKFNLKKQKRRLEDALRESNMIENKLQYVILCNGDVNLSTFARELFVNWERYFVQINTMSYNPYGVNKFGDNFCRLKHARTIDAELNMTRNKIVGLPTYMGDLTGDGDVVSHRIIIIVIISNLYSAYFRKKEHRWYSKQIKTKKIL